jgi:hypothetical protein
LIPTDSLQAPHILLLEAAQKQISEELGELLKPPRVVPPEDLAEQRLENDKDRSFIEWLLQNEPLEQIRERFERNKSSGKFPLLSRYLSDLEDEAKEQFFAGGWRSLTISPEPPKKPWDYAPYNGNEEFYREELYDGVVYAVTDLRQFAQEWLEELVRVGYQGVREPFEFPLKQRIDNDSSISRPSSSLFGEARPISFENTRQAFWLQLDGERSFERGYREVRVSDKPLRTDKAIPAALTAMEGRPMDVRRLCQALPELKLPLEKSMCEQWAEAFKGFPAEKTSEGKRPKLAENLECHQPLDYVLLLLRHHRRNLTVFPTTKSLH